MAKKNQSILGASKVIVDRYKDFCAQYRHQLNRYAIEVCGMEPTWQQRQLFESRNTPTCVGKTRSAT